MERNHSSNHLEKYDQIKWSSSDDQMISGSGQPKSYTCTFCKRGFPNAQALGGHMNIHRRDRARIRQFSEDQNQLASDVTKDSSNSHHQHHRRTNSADKIMELNELGTSSNIIAARRAMASYPFSRDEDDDAVIIDAANKGKLQLPLFLEEPCGLASVDINNDANGCGGCRNEETIMKRTEELDLELRLGPKPTETSITLSTREFF